jgi:hypothetical protein
VVLSCPVGVASFREGVHTCCLTGKQSVSMFRFIGYDGDSDTSLVECVPVTGRTHQLRLHLQFLGSPIANDPCYGGTLFYGEPGRKDVAVQLLTQMRLLEQVPMSKVPHLVCEEVDVLIAAMKEEDKAAFLRNRTSPPSDMVLPASTASASSEDVAIMRNCRYCRDNNSPELERLLHCDGIWLHAQRYEGKDWSFTAPLPSWAKDFDTSTLFQGRPTDYVVARKGEEQVFA